MKNTEDSGDGYILDNWSKKDKLSLYHALKTFGSKDITKIQDKIPHKTFEEIKTAVNYYKEKAIKIKQSETAKIEKQRNPCNPRIPLASWAKFLTDSLNFDELETEITSAVNLLAHTEKRLPPICTDNVNIKDIYCVIANAMEGKPVQLDKTTEIVLKKCILETALISKEFIRHSSYSSLIDSLDVSEHYINVSPIPTPDIELSTIRYLAAQRNYNPLNILEQFLKPSTCYQMPMLPNVNVTKE